MEIEITATKRTLTGTGASRRLRHAGRVPAIVYGGGDAAMIELDHNTVFHKLRNEAFHSSILALNVDGEKQQVLLRDVQRHPFRPIVMHLDFQRVSQTEKIHVKVPLHFINADVAPGVKMAGGIVTHIITEVDVSCLAKDLPEYIEIDLSSLEAGQSVHLSELKMPAGAELTELSHGDQTVATVTIPRGVTAAEEADEAAAAAAAAPAPAEAAPAATKPPAGGKEGKDK